MDGWDAGQFNSRSTYRLASSNKGAAGLVVPRSTCGLPANPVSGCSCGIALDCGDTDQHGSFHLKAPDGGL